MNTINTGEQVVLRMHDGGAVWGTLDRINETHIVLNEFETDDPYTLAKYGEEVGFPFSDITRVFYKDNVFWEAKKTCRNCTVEKPISEYNKDSSSKDLLFYICKECVKDKNKVASIRGRIAMKPIQDKHGVTQTDAAIIWGVNDEATIKTFSKHLQLNETTGCIEWTAATNYGYGYFMVNNGVLRLSTVKAHRFAWAMRHGVDALPKAYGSGNKADTLVLNHLCHNRSCVNPDHLEAITVAENNSTAKRKPKESTDV